MRPDTTRLRRRLAAARDNVPEAVARSRIECAEDLLSLAQDIIPVETGVALASGYAEHGDEASEVGFGGMAQEYIWPLHENLEAQHAPGKSAKFLETPFAQNRGRYAKTIIDAGKEALRG